LAVPNRQLLDDSRAFGPNDLKAIGDAFNAALTALGFRDEKDPGSEIVGRKIIRAALDGERDPVKLYDEVAVSGDRN
jgi:hypothetical protein